MPKPKRLKKVFVVEDAVDLFAFRTKKAAQAFVKEDCPIKADVVLYACVVDVSWQMDQV